jgi:hypothetical protein
MKASYGTPNHTLTELRTPALHQSLRCVQTGAMQTPETGPALPADASARAVLRQLIATLAYRAAKVLRDAPEGFGAAKFGSATRRPVRIVAHMADLMAWGVSYARGEPAWKPEGSDDWNREVERFFDGLGALDRELAADNQASVAQLVQGPLSDALTHVGQLAMLRGMAGEPVRPENYARAAITAGRLGLDQAAPVREFDGDASDRK